MPQPTSYDYGEPVCELYCALRPLLHCALLQEYMINTPPVADAPVSEAGDLTPKFHAIRELIAQHSPATRSALNVNVNANANANAEPEELSVHSLPKRAYGRVQMRFAGGLERYLQWAHANGKSRDLQLPEPMERLGHYAGFMLYSHTCSGSGCRGALAAFGVRDLAYVYDQNWRYRGNAAAALFFARHTIPSLTT